jgi:hypothetical protein
MGRIGLSALKNRQYQKDGDNGLTRELREALLFLAHIDKVPPRILNLRAVRLPPLLIYSDASWPSRMDGTKEITIPRIGWVIFDPLENCQPRGFSTTVGWTILKHLITREQQILAVEAFAAAAAPWLSPQIFSGRESIWFIDNAAAVSTLIRGSSRPEDIDHLAAAVAFQNAALNHRPWFEWIDSDSNPSDGLSRLGITDPWTVDQGWTLKDVSHTDWGGFFEKYSLPSVLEELTASHSF